MRRPAPPEVPASPDEGPSLDPLYFRLFNEIGIIEQLSRALFERMLPHGLTVSQFTVLNHFVRLGGERSLVELANAFQVTKPAMTKTVRKLSALKFIKVRPNPDDSRGKLVSITPRGVGVRHAAVAAIAPLVPQLQQVVADRELEKVMPKLTLLREWLDTHRDPDSIFPR